MINNNFKQLKKEYMDIPIPEELDFVVRKAIKESRSNGVKRKGRFSKAVTVAASIAATVAVLTVGINTSPAFAKTLSKVPLVGSIVKVLTFREYTVDENTFNANIKVPEISGLKDKNYKQLKRKVS